MTRGVTRRSVFATRLTGRCDPDAPSGRCHPDEPSAGRTTFQKVRSESLKHKAATKPTRRDLSLLQWPKWKPENNCRLDPAAFVDAAGGKSLPPDHLAYQMFETQEVDVSMDKVRARNKYNDATDPITHFRHEGLDWDMKWKSSKRSGYNSRAAKQSWTWSQDSRVRDAMNLNTDPNAEKVRYLLGHDGVMRYNMWGAEDLKQGATADCIKCELPPELSHILKNDRSQMPYFLRENDNHGDQRSHNHGRSDRIWDVLRDEAYQKVLNGESPEPGQAAVFRRYWRDQAREVGSEDESMEYRRMRSSRSLPPERLGSFTRALRERSAGVKTNPYEHDVGQKVRPATASGSSPPSESKEATLSMASRSVNRSDGRQDAPARSMTARPSRAEQSRANLGNSHQGGLPQKFRPPSDSGTRSATTRSEASLSMTPLSITNASLVARKDSALRAATQRSGRNAS